MPGFTIHIITAKEYIKNHKNEIKDEKEFINGAIAPDLTTNKNSTHYGTWENLKVITHLERMLDDSKVDMKKDYWKGYFYHLYVDDKFYNQYFYKEWKDVVKNGDRLFNDYYILNNKLINDYKINIEEYPEQIKKYMLPVDTNEKTQYLNYSKLQKMILELSNINIYDEVEKIRNESSI